MTFKHYLTWLWLAAAAWQGLFAGPGTRGIFLPRGHEHSALHLVGAVLLALATVATWHYWLSAARPTYAGVAALFGASACFCAILAVSITQAMAHGRVVRSNLELAAIPAGTLDFLCQADVGEKKWQTVARFAYTETGICASGRTADGRPLRFEPTAEQKTKRADLVAMRRENEKLVEEVSNRIRDVQYAGTIYLAVFPFVSTLYLLWLKLRTRGSPG